MFQRMKLKLHFADMDTESNTSDFEKHLNIMFSNKSNWTPAPNADVFLDAFIEAVKNDFQNLRVNNSTENPHKNITIDEKNALLHLNNNDIITNKANLRDLIAATGLVILLKFNPNHRFFSPCDLEIWWMTLKNNRAPLLCYFKLCAAFRTHWWIQAGVTVRKRPIWVKIDDFFSRVTLQFDVWPWKTIGHLFYSTSSFVHHFVAIGDFKLELQSGNAQFGSNAMIFRAVWPWNLTDDLEKQ